MIRITIAGDYAPRYRVSEIIENNDSDLIFSGIQPILDNTDYAIVNMEAPYCLSLANPLKKYGPNLHSSKNEIKLLKTTGFDCVCLANNHLRDYGDDGVMSSLSILTELDISYMGAGTSLEDSQKIFYTNIKGEKVAFINVCENEFSIATNNSSGAAPLDTVSNYYQIKAAKDNADYVIMVIHGGHEHYQYPSPRMKRLYRFFIDLGVDAVVNNHQHCYSGYEVYNRKPIIYGLGNFCFDHPKKRGDMWNQGYMVTLFLEKTSIGFELHPYIQCDDRPTVELMSGNMKETFFNKIDQINRIIVDDSRLLAEYQHFVKQKRRAVLGVFTPYTNEYIRAAAGRHWLPYFLPRQKILAMINYISCESQRDATLDVLNDMI